MKKVPENPKIFYCENCDYNTCLSKDFNKHLYTSKHINRTKLNVLEQKIPENPKEFCCKYCNKYYKARNSLWYHNQKCNNKESNDIENNNTIDIANNDEIILQLLKQNYELIKDNSEFKNIIMKVIENGTHNIITNTNSHNKAFNLNLYLNETCKNAMNITDFVDSIKLQLNDLMDIGEIGFVEGISKIIVKNLNNLDETERPIHCTDKKRETMYIKDQDKWEKEDDNKTKLRKVVKNVANKNIKLLPQYREKYPEYKNSSSNVSDIYDKMVIEVMTSDDNQDEKIIKNISKVTTIKS
jgi:hypothetical protein